MAARCPLRKVPERSITVSQSPSGPAFTGGPTVSSKSISLKMDEWDGSPDSQSCDGSPRSTPLAVSTVGLRPGGGPGSPGGGPGSPGGTPPLESLESLDPPTRRLGSPTVNLEPNGTHCESRGLPS